MLVIFKYARETRYLWESCGKYFHKAEKQQQIICFAIYF